jgi:hypothetical protein
LLPSLSLELLSVSESDPELLSESLEELLLLLLLPLLLPLLDGGTEPLQLVCWTTVLPAHQAPREGREGKPSEQTGNTSKLPCPKRKGEAQVCTPVKWNLDSRATIKVKDSWMVT